MPVLMRLVVALAVVAASCGGSGTTPATVDPAGREALAAEYGSSALRALEESGESLTASDVAGLVLSACDLVDEGADPLAAATGAVSETIGAGADLVVEVVQIGIDDVCPPTPPSSLDIIIAYEASVAAAMTASGAALPQDPEAVLTAGPVVCEALDIGSSPEQAVLAAAGVLFGVTAPSVSELSASGLLSEGDSLLLGAVLGSASAILCSEHRSDVEAYLEELS